MFQRLELRTEILLCGQIGSFLLYKVFALKPNYLQQLIQVLDSISLQKNSLPGSEATPAIAHPGPIQDGTESNAFNGNAKKERQSESCT